MTQVELSQKLQDIYEALTENDENVDFKCASVVGDLCRALLCFNNKMYRGAKHIALRACENIGHIIEEREKEKAEYFAKEDAN